MRYAYIAILLSVLMLVVNFNQIPYRIYILIALSAGIGYNVVQITKLICKRTLTGQIVIRRQRKGFSFLFLLTVLMWTVFAIAGQSDDIYLAIFFWTILIAEIISGRIYKKLTPDFIAIDNNTIIINSLNPVKRDITRLRKITHNGLTDSITLYFSGKSALSIDRADYNQQDIIRLLIFLSQHSTQKPVISENLEREMAKAELQVSSSEV